MRVESIQQVNIKKRISYTNKSKVVHFSGSENDEKKFPAFFSFFDLFVSKSLKNQKTENSGSNSRTEFLKKNNISEPFIKKFSELDEKSFSRVKELLKEGVSPVDILKLVSLTDEKYEQAMNLTKLGVVDSFVFQLASQEEDGYLKTLDYFDKGFDSDALLLFSNLSKEEEQEAIKLLEKGYSPFLAGSLAKLEEEQRQLVLDLRNSKVDIDNACNIASLEESKRNKALAYLKQGIEPEFVPIIASLDETSEKRVPELISLNVGSVNIDCFAKMNDKDYARMKELLSLGVQPDYIADIILIERGEFENKEYLEYRRRGYGYTTAFSISLLEDEKIAELTKIIDKNPDIKKLLKEECDVSVENLQYTEDFETIFERNYSTSNGTNIKIVDMFYENGNSSKSRLETYSDFSTSSTTSPQGNVYKIRYDKFGEIKELFEIVQDTKTNEVTGVIHLKASKVLEGVFDTVYYDISQFKETTTEINSNLLDIENAVNGEGVVLSQSVKNADGSISYTESFSINDYEIDRNYSEVVDEATGEIISSDYSYRIRKEDEDTPLMDITRSFEKRPDGSVLNSINGVEYKITYDDEKKIITITDGENTKKYDVNEKLPYYSKDVLWNKIKSLQVDTIMTIFDNISKWNYCENEDSVASSYGNILSTGLNTDIIIHESGHIKSNEKPSILDDDLLLDIYGEEMNDYMNTLPYNEQEFTAYFSPRASILDSDGFSEFVAESHILLNSFGTRYQKLKTRTQLLARYFPRTIARIAELTGKTSTESLLK